MKFAIVNDGRVVNIAESIFPLNDDWHQIDNGSPVGIGDAYNEHEQVFYDENGNLRMNYVQMQTQDQVDQAHNQIAELEIAFDALIGGVNVALGL